MYRYKGIIFNDPKSLVDHICNEEGVKSSFKYIYHKYGRSYLKRFKIEPPKRRVIEYPCDDFKKYKHRNVKFHYKCKNCGVDVYTTWFLIDHFKDNLCKYCRKHPSTN